MPPIQAARNGSFILLGKRISWVASCPLSYVLSVQHYLFMTPLMPPIQAARNGSFIVLGKIISWVASCPLSDVLTVLHYLFYGPFDAPNPGSQERLLHCIRKEDILSGFLSTLLWKLIFPFHKFANLLFLCRASFSICPRRMCLRTLFLGRGVLGQRVPLSKCPSCR